MSAIIIRFWVWYFPIWVVYIYEWHLKLQLLLSVVTFLLFCSPVNVFTSNFFSLFSSWYGCYNWGQGDLIIYDEICHFHAFPPPCSPFLSSVEAFMAPGKPQRWFWWVSPRWSSCILNSGICIPPHIRALQKCVDETRAASSRASSSLSTFLSEDANLAFVILLQLSSMLGMFSGSRLDSRRDPLVLVFSPWVFLVVKMMRLPWQHEGVTWGLFLRLHRLQRQTGWHRWITRREKLRSVPPSSTQHVYAAAFTGFFYSSSPRTASASPSPPFTSVSSALGLPAPTESSGGRTALAWGQRARDGRAKAPESEKTSRSVLIWGWV